MKLNLALLSAATASSHTLEILQKYVNAKDLPYIPQTEYTDIKRGADLTFTVEVVKETALEKDFLIKNLFAVTNAYEMLNDNYYLIC